MGDIRKLIMKLITYNHIEDIDKKGEKGDENKIEHGPI
jgi:hypothetical protein